jgi:PAT family beta-lactamase induction signal transducer AmpG
MALLVGAGTYAVLLFFALGVMPKLSNDHPVHRESGETIRSSFKEIVFSFFRMPKIFPILMFILLYRFGESMLTKMAGPFMLDPNSKGGLGLDTLQVGMILGNVGVISLVTGGLLGGFVISKYGLKRCIWPMVIIMTIPNFFYIWVAHALPPISFIYILTSVEYFSYGFGLTAYMVFAMYCSQKSKYATSHYAILTGFIALGAMLAGISSGYLQQAVGYFWFFIWVCVATIPGLIATKFIPLDIGDEHENAKEI